MGLINTFFTVGIILIVFERIDVSKAANCNEHTDCQTCTSHKTWTGAQCPWCPLTKSCHAKWSWWNQCTNEQNIQSVSECESSEDSKYTYDADEAYKLALFSALAYNDRPRKCLKALFPDSDYNIETILLRKCDDYFFSYDKKCMTIVATSELNKEVIVAFRGSRQIAQVIDQVLTTIGLPAASSAVGGDVQHYFKNVFKKFYGPLKKTIESLRNSHPDYKVTITGHSLGGAVASITSAMLVNSNMVKSENISLYTFGMPKVGNKDYALAFDKLVPNSWRVVREGDFVAVLPTCIIGPVCSVLNGPYHHGNKIIYTDANMTKDSTYLVCDGNEDDIAECTRIEQQEIGRKRSNIFPEHTFYFGIQIGEHCNNLVD